MLQKMLIDYDSSVPDRSYVATFWDDMYLTGRYPPIIHSNPYLLLHNDDKIANDTPTSQLTRVTQILLATAKFVGDTRLQHLKPDLVKGSPLDATQYSQLFGTRIPRPDRDEMFIDNNSRHVLVLRKNKRFTVEILRHDNTPLPAAEIVSQLRHIFSATANHVESPFDIGAFTGGEREPWAAFRTKVKKYDYVNRATFDDIETAIVCVALEDYKPKNMHDAALQSFHGYGKNRWFDKTNIWIAFNDGTVGYNFEHSPVDGHTVVRYVSDVHADKSASSDAVAAVASQQQGSKTARELRLNLTRAMDAEIVEAGKKHIEFVNSNDHVLASFTDFGGDFIKQSKISPDGFVQMAYQLAYYRRYGKNASTYESCSTKNFLAGRTETIRSVTDESADLCRSFDKSGKDDRARLLRAAAAAHVERAKLAQQGLGVDRHLYALRHLAEKKAEQDGSSVPLIFKDKGYPTLSTSVLSTSNLGSVPSLKVFGFGAVCEQGYGFGYGINPEDIPLTISSWKKDTQGMKDLVHQALNDFKNAVKP